MAFSLAFLSGASPGRAEENAAPPAVAEEPPSEAQTPPDGDSADAAGHPPAEKREQTGLLLAPPDAGKDGEAEPAGEDLPSGEGTDATVIEDPFAGQYVKGTPAKMSQLYWRLRVFDLDDERAVDNYMLINECDIYQRFINDDFEWAKVRGAARELLEKDRDGFTQKFEFILPVRLGRYDTDKGGFYLIDDSAFGNVRRMEITGNSLSREICGKTGEIKDYPRNLMLILEHPIIYDFAKVDEHVAQAYILRKQKEVLKYDYDVRQSRYDRIAYVRLRTNLQEYQGTVKGQDGSLLAILYGKLEGVDLFEDPYGKILLSTLDVAPASAPANETVQENPTASE